MDGRPIAGYQREVAGSLAGHGDVFHGSTRGCSKDFNGARAQDRGTTCGACSLVARIIRAESLYLIKNVGISISLHGSFKLS